MYFVIFIDYFFAVFMAGLFGIHFYVFRPKIYEIKTVIMYTASIPIHALIILKNGSITACGFLCIAYALAMLVFRIDIRKDMEFAVFLKKAKTLFEEHSEGYEIYDIKLYECGVFAAYSTFTYSIAGCFVKGDLPKKEFRRLSKKDKKIYEDYKNCTNTIEETNYDFYVGHHCGFAVFVNIGENNG